MVEIRDEQLVDAFIESGEICHFDELVRRHIGKVRSMIYPMVLNDADADDLTQEVFLRVVNNISGFRKRALFSTWLHRVVMNTTHSFLRKKSRSSIANYADTPEQPDNSSPPASSLVAAEIDSQIRNALASLSPSLRSAITLIAIQGMSVKETAKVEGCLAATIYWRVHEARRILRNKLRGEGIEV